MKYRNQNIGVFLYLKLLDDFAFKWFVFDKKYVLDYVHQKTVLASALSSGMCQFYRTICRNVLTYKGSRTYNISIAKLYIKRKIYRVIF